MCTLPHSTSFIQGLWWRPIEVALHRHFCHVGRPSHGLPTYGLFPILHYNRHTSTFAPWHCQSNLPASSARHSSFLDQPYCSASRRAPETAVSPGSTRLRCLCHSNQSRDLFQTRACRHHRQVRLQTRWPHPHQKYHYREVSQSQNRCEISRSTHSHISKQGWHLHCLQTRRVSLRPSNCSILSNPLLRPPTHRHSSSWWTNRHLCSPAMRARGLTRCRPQQRRFSSGLARWRQRLRTV